MLATKGDCIMGFFKKLVGSAAVIGAAVGGVSYLKKRKEEKYTEYECVYRLYGNRR